MKYEANGRCPMLGSAEVDLAFTLHIEQRFRI